MQLPEPQYFPALTVKAVRMYLGGLVRGIVRNIISKLRSDKALEQRVRYLESLLRTNLPEHLVFDPETLQKVEALLKKDFDLRNLDLSIHRNDIMYHYHLLAVEGDQVAALYSHFAVGARFLEGLKEYLNRENQGQPGRILDFGSGYGRVSRLIPQYWAEAQVSVSEVKAEAMSFQERFGFRRIVHTQDSGSIEDGEYDLIMALSVFSHLPEKAFKSWLKALISQLSIGGSLVFSFNPLKESNSGNGFRFVRNSEDLHFPHIMDANQNTEDYGHAYLSRKFIIESVSKEGFTVRFLEHLLTAGQETVRVTREE